MSKEIIEKKLIDPLTKLYINHIKQTEYIIKSNTISINFWQMQKNSLLENEPFKIFKKKHILWENKLKDINKHLEELYKSRQKTIEDLKGFKFDSS